MQHKEALSAYMDGYNINGEFTDTLCQSNELKQTWENYHTIRSVMRNEQPLLGHDFSIKMEMLLENEEIEQVIKPGKRGLLLKLKKWSTPLMQAGIAASVCLVAVVGVNVMQGNDNELAQTEQPVLHTLPFSNSVQQVSYNVPEKEQPTTDQLEYQQRRINALLQNHELQRRAIENSEEKVAPEKESTQEVKDRQQPNLQ